jgi:hypothetical protein
MPWVKRSRQSKNFYWMVGAIAFAVATVIGYELGNSTALVQVVEKHLATSDAQVQRLEKRIRALEAKFAVGPAETRAKITGEIN